MSKALVWDAIGERKFETGLSKGVIYPYNPTSNSYTPGAAWNGLSSVSESPEGAEANDIWADDMKYAILRSPENFGGSIECYMYPDEFAACNGEASPVDGVVIGQQSRKMFGLSYRTRIGSDTDPDASDYKLHLIYGATCSPSEKQYQSVNESPEANTMTFEYDTTPVEVNGFKPTSLIVINSAKVDKEKLTALEKILYGSEEADATLPMPDVVLSTLGYTATPAVASVSEENEPNAEEVTTE